MTTLWIALAVFLAAVFWAIALWPSRRFDETDIRASIARENRARIADPARKVRRAR